VQLFFFVTFFKNDVRIKYCCNVRENLKEFVINFTITAMTDFLFKQAKGILCQSHYRGINLEDLLNREPVSMDSENVSAFIRNRKIMITGAAGSIGKELVRHIISFKPEQVVLIDLAESGIYEMEADLKDIISSETKIETIPANITDPHRMKHIFQKYQPQIVFHAAANKHVPMMEKHPYEAINTNIFGTKLLADLAMEYQIEKFIFISTDKAVNPTNVMGATKRVGEMYLQNLNNKSGSTTQFIIIRFGNVLGTQGSAVPLFIDQINEGGPVTITHPEVMRYFITIQEACQLVLEAGAIGCAGEVFVLDMGEPVLIKDLAEKLIQLAGSKVQIKLSYIGLRPGEKLLEERLRDDEKNKLTHHAKITIAQLTPVCSDMMNEMLLLLKRALEKGEDDELVSILKEIVPEYISNNSEFEKLDLLREGKSFKE
jgi:FlaA1/EpsC-like NDP-sugar epimerase